MRELRDYRTNTDKRSDPDTRVAQGDFPTKIVSVPTRSSYMEPERKADGSVEDGVSFEKDLYQVHDNPDDEGGIHYVI